MAYLDSRVIPELTAAGAPVVDLRGRLPRNTTYPKSTSWDRRPVGAITIFAWHYDAIPLRDDWPYDPVARYAAEAQSHIDKDWGGGYHAPTIAYHIKIAGNGGIYLLNDLEEITWNANNANGIDVGICVDLGVDQSPTDAQVTAAQALADILSFRCPEIPAGQADHKGHGELGAFGNATACPGRQLGYVTRYRATGKMQQDVSPVSPVSSEVVAMLTDDEILTRIAKILWAGHDFDPSFAIPRSWVAELRGNRYRGVPLTAEQDIGAGRSWQRFEYGLAIYVPGKGVSWAG